MTNDKISGMGGIMKIEEKNGQLVIVDFNELEAYKIACKIEEDGLHFYKKLMEKISGDAPKSALAFLIKEEEEHLKFFEESLFKLEEKEEDSFEGDDLLSTMDYGVFRPYEDSQELEKILSDMNRTLHLGIVIEDKSIKFYEFCKRKVKDKKVKAEISKIIKEERKHKQHLEDML